MRPERAAQCFAVFDIGGTWFRWGLYDPVQGLGESGRAPAMSYLSHPDLNTAGLQRALVDFVGRRVREMREDRGLEIGTIAVSVGAPVNAHTGLVLGSGPLWGPTGMSFDLQAGVREALPGTRCVIVNDVTALLAPYMYDGVSYRKTMLITVSTGIGSRLYDHRTDRIPYDDQYGVQGEIGHLACSFELDGQVIIRRCECGAWNHLNAFSSGRGIAQTLTELASLSRTYRDLFPESAPSRCGASEEYRLRAFSAQLDSGSALASSLLDDFVRPLARIVTTAICVDPEIDRVVMTGGVARGLGTHYRDALERAFSREGLYQMSEHDRHHLTRRLSWDSVDDDFAGLRGVGLYATRCASRSSTCKE